MIEPYYDDGLVTIFHGDCMEVLPALADSDYGLADLIFTSPPYNLGVSTGGGFAVDGRKTGLWHGRALRDGYQQHNDALPLGEYEEWQQAALSACWARLSERGAIFYNHKPRVQAGVLWLPLRLNPGLPLRQIIVWDRGSGFNFAPTHYVPTHEWIMVLAKPGFRLRSKGASGHGDTWREPPLPSDHPAPFPVGLPARAIESVAPTLVLDPFMGSGTTLRAAKDVGVRAIGIDSSERYCEMAVRRLAQEAFDFGAAA